MKTKVCKRCNEPRLIAEFGVNKKNLGIGEKDGRNIWCKQCINDAQTARRIGYRALRALKPKPAPRPKTEVLSDTAQVLNAINAGCRTRDQIRTFTRLHEDAISDALAILAFDDRSVRVDRSGSEAKFYPIRVAA